MQMLIDSIKTFVESPGSMALVKTIAFCLFFITGLVIVIKILSWIANAIRQTRWGCSIVAVSIFLLSAGFLFWGYIKQHLLYFLIALAVVIFVIIVVCVARSLRKDPYGDFGMYGDPWEAPFLDKEPTLSETIGIAGENLISSELRIACKKDGRHYRIMRNLYIPTRDGTSEIDILLIHETGIYVFESKNLTGTVIGDLEHPKWLVYKNRSEPRSFVNPLQQNAGHITALCDYMKCDMRKVRIYSIVVFGEASVLKRVPDDTPLAQILTAKRLRLKIRDILRDKPNYISPEKVDKTYNYLASCENVSQRVKDAHKERITRKFGKIS